MAAQEVIAFNYTVKNSKGDVLDKSAPEAPFAILAGQGHIIPALEKELAAMGEGDTKTVELKADDAYGQRDEKLIIEVERNLLPTDELEEGMMFAVNRGDGSQGVAKVVSFNDEKVVMDNNHPLAGEDLTFDVELVQKRDATEDEVAHGHAHGADGQAAH